jgi:hypothetical protein
MGHKFLRHIQCIVIDDCTVRVNVRAQLYVCVDM